VKFVQPLENATALAGLDLTHDPIQDPKYLAKFTQLDTLEANGTGLIDLSFLPSLTNLTELHLGSNPLSDITATAGLAKLKVLDLVDDEVSDIEPLRSLGTQSLQLLLAGNPLSDQALQVTLPVLCERDWEIQWTGGGCGIPVP
jgi:internalin A